MTVHRCVGILLCQDDRILLAKRSRTKTWYPGCWDVIGGHFTAGETTMQAIAREASEELGITLDPADVVTVGVLIGDDIELTVFATCQWHGTVVNAAPEEHELIAWLTVDQLSGLEMADPAIQELAVKALQITSG